MKLSIIVPVYNMAGDGKLQYCLDSLLCQQAEDYEVLCVDDASTDESYEIAASYAEKYPDKFRVFASKVNQKQGGARNIGLRMARGEWIGFMDSDDWASPDMYAKLLEKAERTGADVAGCQYQITSEHSMKPGRTVVNNTPEQTGVLTAEKYASLLKKPGSMAVKVYKKQVLDRYSLHFPEGIFYEDNCAAPVWLLHFTHFELVDEPLYYYYQHQASTVHQISREKCMDRMKAGELLVEWCREGGFYEPYYKELEYKFTELYYVNTLFSYVVGQERASLSFLREMADGMRARFPGFQSNPYFRESYDAEQKRLIRLHMRSSLLFLAYYRLLNGYRKARGRITQKN